MQPSPLASRLSPLAPPQAWNAGTIYFLLTDRFINADPSNDLTLGRQRDAALLRGFEGGDLKGVLRAIESGYFTQLGVTAIWMTPWVEQNAGFTDEGTGRSYGYHGYWARDWTAVDPNLGTEDDLRTVVAAAHARGIKVLMDAVINHTGPAIPSDPAWPDAWVRREPACKYTNYENTTSCTLVANLSDIRTDSDAAVELPPHLVAKWTREGRLERERAELDAWFARTGYPRAPRYYVMKWLTDWVREYGIDGYRVDTAKHFEEAVSAELKREGQRALDDWRRAQPGRASAEPFYMVGEVYDYTPERGRWYDFGDRRVDYFAHGYDALINFAFKRMAAVSADSLFRFQADVLGGPLAGKSLLNYLTSHDDGAPYDRARTDPFAAAEKLLLAPGTAQIYYGDETARVLTVDGAVGDANLRAPMNWADTATARGRELLDHWRRLGQFRARHAAVGAGGHIELSRSPLVFARVLGDDIVVVALGSRSAATTVSVAGLLTPGTVLRDAYGGGTATVGADGRLMMPAGARPVLYERK